MGKRVLVIEDGPTLTHGEMKYGVGIVAAERFGAAEIIDPRPYTVGTITETFENTRISARCFRLWAMVGNRSKTWKKPSGVCPAIWSSRPLPSTSPVLAKIYHPVQRVSYVLLIIGQPTLEEILKQKLG